jgi:hypothetical protein
LLTNRNLQSHSRLNNLPYSLVDSSVNAIWLAENQATGQIKLQTEYDEELKKEVLTCYLLPQQNFHTPSMENLLQGSINTDANSHNLNSESNQHNDGSAQKPMTESVRFAPDSDGEDKPVSEFAICLVDRNCRR